MKRFLKNLFRDFVTGPARGGKPASRRTLLQAEGLEDRMVLSSAGMSGSTLVIDVSPNTTVELYELNPTGTRQIEVLGIASSPPTFNINSIGATEIIVSGGDTIYVNDSDGMPFVSNTTTTFNGSGSGNSIDFFGSRAIDTSGVYVVGGTASTESSLQMDRLAFEFNSAIGSVTDSIQLTGGPLDVATSGQDVVLSSPYSGAQRLSGMGPGGGGTFTYFNMNTIDLNEYGANATVNLDTAGAASLEHEFSVITHASGDTVVIAATPSSVSTGVEVNGTGSEVFLETNSGGVSIAATPSTSLIVGLPTGSGRDTTKGIDANVLVSGVGLLLVSDNANVSTNETVTVTQSTISGTGLFGNNAAAIFYSEVPTISMISGQLTDSYTVKASSTSAEFNTKINLFDDSSKAFSAHVDLDADTHLNLALYNQTTKAGELYIDAPGATYENSTGVVDVYFDGVLSSQIGFSGFTIEEEKS